MSGKGDKARPMSVSSDKFANNFDAIFQDAKKNKDKSSAWHNLKSWLMSDIVIKRVYFAVVYFCLFGFIAYEIIIY